MKIIFIGAGNLATNLATELKSKAFNVSQIYSRTKLSAKTLADKIDCRYTTETKDIDKDADLYIFSVKDSVLESILQQTPQNNGIWVHTAGSVPMDIFKKYNRRFGVVYPFQTFSKERNVNFREIPFFIEADSDETFVYLSNAFSSISDKIIKLDSDKRKHVHLTGVFACNFVNHMYRISTDILDRADIPFDVLLPLIDETASKVHTLSPQEAQTGPAIRFDENVMEKHLSLIDDPQVKDIYKLISKNIHEKNN